MKTFVRIGSLVLALGAAGLLAGCAGHRNHVVQRTRPVHDFEIVETSTKRVLNPQEMAVLKAKVAAFLEKEGATASGDYYVKVFLAPDAPGQDGAASEWVIVRFTRDTDLRFSLLASYPAYSTSSGSYAAYDYYPYGYDSFGRISFQYYDDSYYGSRYYFPPSHRNSHDRNRDRDGDHDHDGGKDRDHHGDGNHKGDTAQTQDPRRFKPSAPAPTPQVTRTRWDGGRSGQNNQDNQNNTPRREHHGSRRDAQPASSTATAPVAQPAVQSVAQPERQSGRNRDSGGSFATRSEMNRNQATRTERNESSSQNNNSSASSYSPPARTESSQSSNSDSSSRESGPPSYKRGNQD